MERGGRGAGIVTGNRDCKGIGECSGHALFICPLQEKGVGTNSAESVENHMINKWNKGKNGFPDCSLCMTCWSQGRTRSA